MGIRTTLRRLLARLLPLAILPATVAGFASIGTSAPAGASAGCQLQSANGAIKHLIQIQFDNVHFRRDNPNVPSDLEQMPNLYNFLTSNGSLLTNHHTPLISHTADDILTTLTGVYGDRHGQPVANSYRYFNPNGTTNPASSFAYWTSPLFDFSSTTPSDTTPTMLAADGKNAPAPWVPYTRAGCNFGAVAAANTILENNQIDIPTVFGPNSPESQETPAQQTADFVGIGVHCGLDASLCLTAAHAKDDKLPDEPAGYTGFKALYGHKYTAEAIGPIKDLNGNVISGFPGFDGMSASVSLGYVAAMQEHGVPVTYAYISDAHDNHAAGGTYGPGEAGYVAQLKSYDNAFGKFFARLATDGINQQNTLFVVTSDENDHYSGGQGLPAGCDGLTTPCVYTHVSCSPGACPPNNVGETNANFAGLLATQQHVTTPFKVHSDVAPTVYITGNPKRGDTVTRNFERAAAQLQGADPQSGQSETIMRQMADPVEMKLLHMITADPARTPTFTYFALPQYFLFAGAPNCNSPCVTQQPGFAWEHGGYQPEIVTTWLGLVGPGVLKQGIDSTTWSDHTDIRATVLALTGLGDDYSHDGRVLAEDLKAAALPLSVRTHLGVFMQLAQAYKQINAPVGEFGLTTLQASTNALKGDDATYASIENQLMSLTSQRNTLAGKMIAALEAATFNGQPINVQAAQSWIAQAQSLQNQAAALASS